MALKQRKQILQIHVKSQLARDRPVGYLQRVTEDLNTGLPSDRVEALNQGPPDYNTSARNHSTTLPPLFTIHTTPEEFENETVKVQSFWSCV